MEKSYFTKREREILKVRIEIPFVITIHPYANER